MDTRIQAAIDIHGERRSVHARWATLVHGLPAGISRRCACKCFYAHFLGISSRSLDRAPRQLILNILDDPERHQRTMSSGALSIRTNVTDAPLHSNHLCLRQNPAHLHGTGHPRRQLPTHPPPHQHCPGRRKVDVISCATSSRTSRCLRINLPRSRRKLYACV